MANSSKEDKNCDYFSSSDNSEANSRSDFFKRGHKIAIKRSYSHIPTIGNLTNIHQGNEKSLGLCGGSDFHDNCM